MKQSILLSALMAFALSSKSQSDFVRVYDELTDNTSNAYAIIPSFDAGFVCVGSTNAQIDADIFLVKTGADGAAQWARQFGGAKTSADVALDVTAAKDGGFILCGNIDNKRALWKVDSEGNDLWMHSFGDEGSNAFTAITETTDGGLLAAGDGMVLTKTDQNGKEIWTRNKPSSHRSAYKAIHELPNGDLLIGGFFTAREEGHAISVLVKTDANGKAIWAQTYGPGMINAIDTDLDGNIWVAGNAEFAVPVVIKIAADGKAIWEGVYEEEHLGSAHSIAVKNNDEAMVFTSGGYFALNGDGKLSHHQTTMDFAFNDGALTGNGEIILAGFSTENIGHEEKFAFMKIGSGAFPTTPSASAE